MNQAFGQLHQDDQGTGDGPGKSCRHQSESPLRPIPLLPAGMTETSNKALCQSPEAQHL